MKDFGISAEEEKSLPNPLGRSQSFKESRGEPGFLFCPVWEVLADICLILA
jgi:hypothetical protein